MKSIHELKGIVGGIVYKHEPAFFILSQGDSLDVAGFSISYPDAGGPSNQYLLNGNTMYCSNQKEDNTWTIPSAVSDSFFSKNTIIIQNDDHYLYVEASYLSAYTS